MRQEHGEEFSTAQLTLLVEKSAQPVADPLDVITRYDQVDSGSRSVCPLCPFSVEKTIVPEPNSLVPHANLPVDGSKEMRDHIVAHLEAIALLSLPEQEELDNAASDEIQSESAKISSRGKDQDLEPLFLTTDAWDEYNLANLMEYDEVSFVSSPSAIVTASSNHIPITDDEDWIYVTSTTRPRAPQLDPGQDPVLIPFVERVRRIQTLELQKRLGIPIIVISDPLGLEVPEEQWARNIE